MKKFLFYVSFIVFMVISPRTVYSNASPKTYQIPICVSNFKALNQIRQEINNFNSLNTVIIKEYIEEQIQKGNIISANTLLIELKEQYIIQLKTSPEEEHLKILQKRIDTLEEIISQNSNKNTGIYPQLIINVSESNSEELEINKINDWQNLCNNGQTQPKYPFSIIEFIIEK